MATILVVDDDPDSLELVELALEPGSHRAILCDRGELALDLAVNERVDAVVLDIMMPGMTGFEVLQAFQKNAFARGIPVMMLSALGDASDRVRGLREGARDYLVKPFDVDELLLRVDNLLTQRSRPGAVLDGSLSCLHMADVLHQVVESQASGLLEVRTGGTSAQITLGQGQIMAATYGALSGHEAVLALLEAESGEFCLLEAGDGLPLPPTNQEISLSEVLMEAAWLTDQLERLRKAIPEHDARLRLTCDDPPAVPKEFARARIPDVIEAFGRCHETSLVSLAEAVGAAPRRVCLAAAWLIDKAAITVAQAQAQTETEAEPEVAVETETAHDQDDVASPEPPLSDLDTAIQQVVSSASERGFPADVVHVLFAAQPDQWESLGTIFQHIPEAGALVDASGFMARVQERGAESLRLVHSEGTLLVHVHILFEMSVARAETMLPMCCGVALWVGAADSAPESALLIDRMTRTPAAIRGVVIPSMPANQAGWGEVIEKSDWWSFASSPPASLIDALKLF